MYPLNDVSTLYRDRHQHKFQLGSVPILSVSVSISVVSIGQCECIISGESELQDAAPERM